MLKYCCHYLTQGWRQEFSDAGAKVPDRGLRLWCRKMLFVFLEMNTYAWINEQFVFVLTTVRHIILTYYVNSNGQILIIVITFPLRMSFPDELFSFPRRGTKVPRRGAVASSALPGATPD